MFIILMIILILIYECSSKCHMNIYRNVPLVHLNFHIIVCMNVHILYICLYSFHIDIHTNVYTIFHIICSYQYSSKCSYKFSSRYSYRYVHIDYYKDVHMNVHQNVHMYRVTHKKVHLFYFTTNIRYQITDIYVLNLIDK